MSEEKNKLLRSFCSDDDLTARSWMNNPLQIGDKVYATDATCLIYFDKTDGIDCVEPDDKTIKRIKSVVPDQNMCIDIKVQDISDAIGKATLVDEMIESGKEAICEACNGDGYVEFEFIHNRKNYYLDGDCPVCGGAGVFGVARVPSGKKILNPKDVIKIGNSIFSVLNIQKILQVASVFPTDTIKLIYQKKDNNASLFFINGANLLLMPMSPGQKPVAEILISK